MDDVHNLSDEHAYFPETGVLLRNSGNIGVIWLESVEYSLNVYVTMDFTYSVAEDFYFNNFSTRTFLAGNSTTGMLNLQSGLVANIGSAITWKCIYQGNEKYTLQPNGVTNVYLDHNGNYVTTKSDSTLWICSTSTGIGGVKWIARGTGYEYVLAVNNSGNVVIGSPSNFTAQQLAWRMVAADDYDEAVVIQSELIGMWLAPNEEYDYFNNLVLGDWHFVSKEDFEYTVYSTTVAVFNGSKLTGVSPNSSTTIRVKHLPTGLSVFNSLYTASIPEGTYFLKNRQTSDYARVKNGTMTNGQNVVQYDFDESLGEERWIFTLNAATGYYSIKSANSSSTNYYMAVSDDSSSLDKPIVIRSATESTLTDGMKWKVAPTSSGAYKIIPKTGEGSDYVLATSTSLGTNNAKLLQGDYLNNNSYRDEWFFEKRSETPLEGQRWNWWCWATSARMLANNYYFIPNDRTQNNAVNAVKGAVVDEGGDLVDAIKAVGYYASHDINVNTLNLVGEYGSRLSEEALRQLLDENHVVYIARGHYDMSNKRSSGHATLVVGYTMVSVDGVLQYRYIINDPSPSSPPSPWESPQITTGQVRIRSYQWICNGQNALDSTHADDGIWDRYVVVDTDYSKDTLDPVYN